MEGHHPAMPIPIPGQHPQMVHPQMGQQQMPPPLGPAGHGHGAGPHLHQGPPLQVQQLPLYIGFELVPQTLPDGKQSWETARPQLIHKTQSQFAELVKKDKKKVKEVYASSLLQGEKRRQIDRIVDDHQRREIEMNSGLTWKLACIKLAKKDLISGMAKLVVNRVVVTHMEVILKKVLKTPPKVTRRQSVPLPFHQPQVQMHHNPQMQQHQQMHQHPQMHQTPQIHQFPHHQQMPHQGNHFGEQQQRFPPPPPHNHNGHNPVMVPLSRTPDIEVMSDREDYAYDRQENKRDKRDKKYRSRDRSESPEFRVPSSRDRRGSKTSSRPTEYSYDSEALSPGESPFTSLSSSPRQWPDAKRRSSQLKRYHSRKGSDSSRRERRRSIDSNDSFVMVSKSHARGKHGGSSYRSHSIEDWNRGVSPTSRRRESDYRDDHSALVLTQHMNKLKLEHMADKLRQVEEELILSESQNRYGRPVPSRTYSDRPSSLGYIPRPRRETRYMSSYGAY